MRRVVRGAASLERSGRSATCAGSGPDWDGHYRGRIWLHPDYFRTMLAAGAVDCLQADVTRCGGYTGFFKVAALCEAFHIPLSAHCAPQLHAHCGCCVAGVRHIEYFHDHIRIAQMLLAGSLIPENGCLRPNKTTAGHGLVLKRSDAEAYRVTI